MKPEKYTRHILGVLGMLLCLGSVGQNEAAVCFHDDEYRYQPVKLIDIEHLTAKLSIDPYEKMVSGNASFLFRQTRSYVDSVVFFAPDFSINYVRIDRKDAAYRQNGDSLIISLPANTRKGATHELSVDYVVRPTFDLFFIGWDDTTGRRTKQIWAHRPYRWLPFADDRLTVDMFVTFDEKYMVFSNGVREKVVRNNDKTTTWHYKMYRNHPFFSTALVIGDYRVHEFMTKKGLPCELWYYPDRAGNVGPTYRHMAEMIAYCENEFGLPYPYEVYRQAPVADYLYGGMETTTSTVFGDFMHIDERAFWERNYVNVNIHELVHQWFGNYVSHLRPMDVWLTESLATYYAKLFEREVYGENHYQWERIREKQRVLAAGKKDRLPLAHSGSGVDRWYPKGSLVLDMLRDELGDKDFRRVMTHYLKKHAYQEAWTPDLMRAVQEVTGRSADHFFEQWVLRGGEPELEISQEISGNKLQLRIRQIQETDELRPLFRFPAVIEIHYDDGSISSLNAFISQAELTVDHQWEGSKKVAFVLFDPGERILKIMNFPRSAETLLAQASGAGNLIDRYEALTALRTTDISAKKEVFIDQFRREKFHLNKAEILSQLSGDSGSQCRELFTVALADADPLVRRAAINNLKTHHKPSNEQEIRMLSDTSYSNIVSALKKLTELFPEKTSDYLQLTAHERGFPGLNIRIEWLRIAINAGQHEYIPELVDYSGRSFDFLTRINAMNALLFLRYLDEVSASHIVEAANHWNFRLRPVAESVIKNYFNDSLKNKMILKAYADKGIDLPAGLVE
jgi:aminopeptidase N